MAKARFEWDDAKDRANQTKHHVPFALAQHAFADPHRVIARDISHSQREQRYYCFGKLGDSVFFDGAIHLPRRCHPNFRRRLLAQGQDDL